MKILVINGPNINMLGVREPNIYGVKTYNELLKYIAKNAVELGIDVTFFQSNAEGEIIDAVQGAYKKIDGIIINPAGYTHTSIAIPDAIKAVGIPAVEVHITDISAREEFRKISYTSDACIKTIYGNGFLGYVQAMKFLKEIINI